MHKTTHIYSIVISIVLLVACDRNDVSNELLVAETVLYELASFDIADDQYETDSALQSHYKVSYPKITDQISKETLDKINAHIYGFILESDQPTSQVPNVEKLAKKLFDDFADVYEDREWAPAWLVNKTVRIESKVGLLITLSFNNSFFTGGAHPNSYTEYKIFDLSNGNQIGLYDLVDKANKDQLNQLRLDEFVKQKSELLPDGDWRFYVFEEEFKPKGAFNENQNVKITNENFEFYYNSYEIAAYAFGPTEINIPISEIKPLLLKKSY